MRSGIQNMQILSSHASLYHLCSTWDYGSFEKIIINNKHQSFDFCD